MSLERLINETRELHKKVWGSEDWIINTPKYCGKLLSLKRGYQCSVHYHKIKEETFYVNKGIVLMQINGEMCLMKPGQSLEIIPGDLHRFIGITDAEIMEFSTYHIEEDSYRLEQSGEVPADIFNSYLARYAVEIANE